MRAALVTAVLALGPVGSAEAAPMFSPAVDFAVGPAPTGLVLASVSGNGTNDVITVGSSGVSVLVNTSTGSGIDPPPSFAPVVTFAAGSDPAAVASEDVNRDGRPDLAVANRGSSTVSVFLNTHVVGGPDVSFSGPFDFAVGPAPAGIAFGDLNRDGVLDLATANSGSATGAGGVSVLRNTTPQYATAPSFAGAVAVTAGAHPSGVVVRGMERVITLKPADIVTSNGGSATGAAGVSVIRNTTPTGSPALSFDPPLQLTSGPSPSAVLVTTFYDRIEKPSIVVANGGSADGTGGVSVLANTTPGPATNTNYTFAAKADFDSGDAPSALATALLAEWDGNNGLDILTADAGTTDGASVLASKMTTATPSFAAPFALAAGSDPSAIAFGAVNADVPHDIVVANRGSSTVSVLGHRFTDPRRLTPECTPPGTTLQATWSTSHADLPFAHDQVEDVYSTRVVGRGPDGAVVYDQTAPSPPGSAAVTALTDAARAALAQAYGPAASIGDPAVESASDVLGPVTEYGHYAWDEWTSSTSLAKGPGTILAGEAQSETVFIPAGCDNLDHHGHLARFIYDTSFATATHTATYARTATLPAALAPAPPAGPPAAPAPAATPKPTAPRLPDPPRPASVIKLPSTAQGRTCTSRRRFRIRLLAPKGTPLRSARVLIDGKPKKTVTGTKLAAPVDLAGLPRGTFRITVEVTTASGQKITLEKRYRTCTKKRR